jgi:hypothetical protein
MRIFTLLALLALAPGLAHAQKFGASINAGTFGVGADVAYSVSDRVNLRASFSTVGYGRIEPLEQDDLDLEVDANAGLGAVGAFADWHPTGGAFHFTAGAFYNLNDFTADLYAVSPYYDADVDETFAPDRVGTLNARLRHSLPVAPYLGLGVGNLTKGRFGANLRLGAAYVGSPSLEMTGTGLIAATADNAADLEAGFESFQLYPVLSLGLTFGIGPR